uniref:Uncharacterized protein n=1 Tax=Nelumbo nucifera TaxID=4432 RepID=A0A822ZAG3_NELNU|nr:TPA_asm: hypothetical protein HUJ06_016220 [Nelumbo nucifera]
MMLHLHVQSLRWCGMFDTTMANHIYRERSEIVDVNIHGHPYPETSK